MKSTQVIIVGAGPTGLSMAAQLMRYQIDFIIIEKNQKTTHLSKAIVVQARTLEIFEELGIAVQAVTEGQVTTGMNMFYKGNRKARVNLSGLGEGLSQFPYALSLEQSKTEKILADHLTANGKQILWGSEFIRTEQTNHGVTVYYKDKAGQEQTIEASYLVGCDGASSPVRHQMGLTFEGDTIPKLFYVADVKIKSAVINQNEMYMFMIQKGFILFFPMEGIGHYRIVGILPDAKDIHEEFHFTDIKETIRKEVAVPIDFEKEFWFSTYKVHSRKANSFENNRCFIAGDAAHIHTPAGGQGMNTGIQDAYNLAWKMAGVLKGELNTIVLKTYDSERGKNARNLLRSTDRMFDMMSGVNPVWNFFRLHIFSRIMGYVIKSPLAKKMVFPLISQTGIRYSANDLTVTSCIGKVRSGVRMPYFVFSDRTQIFDYLSEPAFKILFFGENTKNESRELNSGKIKIKKYAFKEIPSSLFRNESDFYVLLRPDNHISYIGKEINKCGEVLLKYMI
ncbi:MAG: Pentachlorophenol monooxygenase [Bacteroidota bacterium]|jgi:2-polyprenyl-6-methoxyphenol hydroxylase-like FAD-dependent oxidoreductase|nr:Pentachlorophenol monooxygenase [Bacteroidota bacterium]